MSFRVLYFGGINEGGNMNKEEALKEIKELADCYNNNCYKFSEEYQLKFKRMLFSLLNFIRCCSPRDPALIGEICFMREKKLFLKNS
jgi:hypothetical protein